MDKFSRLKPVNDVVFKKLFGDKVRKNSLISFLNAVLTEHVIDVEIQEEKLDLDMIDDKLGILDIKAVLSSGEKVNIEVQQVNQYNMIKRTLFYWSKLYAENFKKRLPSTSWGIRYSIEKLFIRAFISTKIKHMRS